MIQNQEFREFFLRLQNQPLVPPIVNGDTPVHQDTPQASREIVIDGITYPIIFKKDGQKEPVFNDDIWIKFLKSIPFKLNESDRAKDSDNPQYLSPASNANDRRPQGGLVVLSTNQQAKAYENGDIARFSRVPRVSQLPSANVEPNLVMASVDFDITLIPQNPEFGIVHRIDPTEDQRNNHLFRISDEHIIWLRDSFNALKEYVDSNELLAEPDSGITIQGTLDGQGSSFVVTRIPSTATDTTKHSVEVLITPSTDPTMGGANASDDIIPSQKAVYDFILLNIQGIDLKADQIDLDALEIRVAAMEGSTPMVEKATLADLQNLEALVLTKLSRIDDDTALGKITFEQVPIIQEDPVNGDDAVRLSYLNTQLALKVNRDGDTMTGPLILSESNDTGSPLLQAATWEDVTRRVNKLGDTMQGFLTLHALPTADFHSVPKIYVDQIRDNLQAQIDALNTRLTLVENKLNQGITVERKLERVSSIKVINGIVTQITT